MKVLLANEWWPPDVSGGTELFLARLRGWLERERHEVRVVAAKYKADDGNALRVASSPIKFAHFYQWPLLTMHWNYHNDGLVKIIKDFGYGVDLFHLNNIWHLGMSPIRAARELGKPALLDIHDWWPLCFRKDMMYAGRELCSGPEPAKCSRCLFRTSAFSGLVGKEIRERSSLLEGHTMITHSGYVAKRFPGAKVVPYSYSGSVARKARKLEDGQLHILFLGRLQKNKGADMLDAVSAGLERRNVEHLIDVGGNGPVRPSGKNMRLHGFVQGEKKVKLLELADMLLVPSRWPEPFGMVVLEAMANGIPVVASKVGGLGELVEGQGCGLTASPESGELADAVMRMVDSPALYARCSAAGLKNIRLFGENKVMSRYEKEYVKMT